VNPKLRLVERKTKKNYRIQIILPRTGEWILSLAKTIRLEALMPPFILSFAPRWESLESVQAKPETFSVALAAGDGRGAASTVGLVVVARVYVGLVPRCWVLPALACCCWKVTFLAPSAPMVAGEGARQEGKSSRVNKLTRCPPDLVDFSEIDGGSVTTFLLGASRHGGEEGSCIGGGSSRSFLH
jgi:hypothetical protein